MNSSRDPTQSRNNAIRKFTLLSVFMTIFLDLVGFGMFIPILPSVARNLNASSAEAAYLSTIFSLGTLLSVLVLGRMSDSLGRRKILISTLLLSIVSQGITGFAPQFNSYALLLLIRFLAGIAAGNISVAQAAIADITPAHERARSMVIIGIAFGAGFALGPAIGALITMIFKDNPIMPIAMTAVALNLANLLLVLFRFRETHHRFAPPELSEVIAIARAGSEASDSQHRSTRQDAVLLLGRPYVKTTLLMQFIQVFGFVGIETILPLVLEDAYSMDHASVYKAFLFLGLMVLIINGGVSRRILGKVGEPLTLNIGQLSMTVGIFLIPWLSPSLSGLYGALALLSLGTAFSNPALSGLISRLSPHDRQGLALGMSQSISASARILGPAFMGLLYERLHGAPSLYISCGLLFIVTLIGMAGLRGLKSRPKI